MERLLAVVGTVILTSKTLFWVSGLGYVFVSGATLTAAYILPMTDDFGTLVGGCADYLD